MLKQETLAVKYGQNLTCLEIILYRDRASLRFYILTGLHMKVVRAAIKNSYLNPLSE